MCCSDYTDGNTRGFLKGLGMACAMDAVSIQDPSSFTNSVQSCLSTRSMRNDVQHAFESDAQGFKDAFKRFNVRKCDTANSSYSNGSGGGQRSYENLGRNTNGGQTTRNRENYLLELRLRWAIRRLQEHIRYVIQRKCEMRLFVILRMHKAGGGMTVESVVLTLHLTPMDGATEETIRGTSNNPKSIMRLMSTEPVEKLYNYLRKKWSLDNYELCFTHKGRSMNIQDPLYEYSDSVSVKLWIDYQLVKIGGDVDVSVGSATAASSTAASTPFCSPAAPVRERLSLTTTEEICAIPASSRGSTVSVVKASECVSIAAPTPTQAVDLVKPLVVEPRSTSPHADSPLSSIVISLCKDMMDKQKEMFVSTLDSQARWMAQMQTQMTTACLTIQEKAIRLALSLGEDDDTTPTKKPRKK